MTPSRGADAGRGPRRAAASLAAVLLVLALPAAVPARAEVIEEIAVWVNDDIITRSDLESRERLSAQDLSGRLQGTELDAAITEERSQLLRDMITEKLLIQQAERLYDMKKMKDSILKNFKEAQEIATDEELNRLLTEEGMTRDELLRRLVDYNAPRSVVEYEVRDKIIVNDAQVEAWYTAHREELATPEEVSFREIVFLSEGRGSEAAMKLAADTVAKLQGAAAPDAFTETATSVSEGPSKATGGLIGPFRRGELNRDVEAVAFALPVGKVSDPIPTSYGAQIIRVETHTQAVYPTLDEAREKITDRLSNEKFQVDLQAYVNKLWSNSTIEVRQAFLDRLTADYRKFVKQAPAEFDLR